MTDSIEVEGVRLGPTSDYVSLLRRQLKHGSVWSEVGDPGPEEGIWRVFEAASGTAIEKKLVDAVILLLTDPDVDVRSGAVGLVQDYTEKMDPPRVLQILERNPSLFEGVKPTGNRLGTPDLAWGVLQALTGNTGRDPKVLSRLKRAAFDTELGFSVLGGLASDDPQWIIKEARSIVSEDPIKARIILANLQSGQQRQKFVEALSGSTVSFKADLRKIIDEKVPEPSEREQLKRILL